MRLELQSLEARAGSFHLGPISLSVGDSEYLAVLGPSGAGKTVTLETIAGLRAATAGKILMDGRECASASPESRRIGFLYQDSLLFPHLNVRGNLAYGAHRIPRPNRDAAISRLTSLMQIEPLLDRTPRGLSGGERQRVALGRALVGNPLLLLLDEPMGALDPNSRAMLRETLLKIHRELGTTTIHVTHDFDEALALGGRVAIMIEGRILQVGAPREVFSKPDSAAIASFLKSARSYAAVSHQGSYAAVILPRGLVLRFGSGNGTSAAILEADSAEIDIRKVGSESEEAIPGRIVSIQAQNGSLRLCVNIGIEMRTIVATSPGDARALIEGASVLVRLPKSPR